MWTKLVWALSKVLCRLIIVCMSTEKYVRLTDLVPARIVVVTKMLMQLSVLSTTNPLAKEVTYTHNLMILHRLRQPRMQLPRW